jgi:hypothetical protein
MVTVFSSIKLCICLDYIGMKFSVQVGKSSQKGRGVFVEVFCRLKWLCGWMIFASNQDVVIKLFSNTRYPRKLTLRADVQAFTYLERKWREHEA